MIMSELTCNFSEAWIGHCRNVRPCQKHYDLVCVSCGAPASHNCDSTGQFVCGANLCADCEHTIFSDGTNGGIGFNAQSLPEGLQDHCRKTEQRFRPWYERQENVAPTPSDSGVGEWRVGFNGFEVMVDHDYIVAMTTKKLAAQIVREHNNHARLVAAARNALDKLFNDGKREGWVEIQQSAIDKLRAALAQLDGKQE